MLARGCNGRMTLDLEKYPLLLSVVMVVDGWIDEVPAIAADVSARIASLVTDYEIIFVDSASGGNADAIYRQITSTEALPNIQVYKLLQQVDYEVAAWAGVENSLGDFVVVFDPFSETLDPLREALAHTIDEKLDVALIVNDMPERSSLAASALRPAFLTLFRWINGMNLAIEASQYRLISKRVIAYLLQQPRPASQYRTLPMRAGFPKRIFRYSAKRRPRARPGLGDDMRRAFRILMSSSTAPARVASFLSLAGAFLNILYSIYVVVLAFTRSDLEPGWVTLSLQQSGMFFLFSLLAFVLTEYLIDTIRGGRIGTSYFVVEELNSPVLTRRDKLNVDVHPPVDPVSPPGAAG